ncbi:MAG: hypothetical protein JW818_04360 [Pirellulales bacterium]|nr:hypothetical protein [Pirellulales bacterium]
MAAKKTAKKNSNSALLVRLRRLIVWACGAGRTWTLAAVMLAVLGGLWWDLWRRHVRQRVLSSPSYLVRAEDIAITPLPPWIQTDLRADVYRDLSVAGPVSIMDDSLNERVAEAFSLQPWVDRVVRVRKSHPARIEVELEYRRPVCMVEVRDVINREKHRLLPIDAQAIFLPPADFQSLEKRIEASTLYPRLSGVEDSYPIALGERWVDERVIGGARIAAAFGPTWLELGLARIVPDARTATGSTRSEPTFILVTRTQTTILWGHYPGAEQPGELSAKQKIALLQQYVSQHGTLDPPDGRKVLDVRSAGAIKMAMKPETKEVNTTSR